MDHVQSNLWLNTFAQFLIYQEAHTHIYMALHPSLQDSLTYEEKILFFFHSVGSRKLEFRQSV
jgi:hypothetical protein